MPSIIKIGQSVAEISRFNGFFFKIGAVRHLGFVGRVLEPLGDLGFWRCDASCQLKSCRLPRNSAETTCTTSREQIKVMKLEGYRGGGDVTTPT